MCVCVHRVLFFPLPLPLVEQQGLLKIDRFATRLSSRAWNDILLRFAAPTLIKPESVPNQIPLLPLLVPLLVRGCVTIV